MSININFDLNWSYCCRTITDNDGTIDIDIKGSMEELDWSPVQLPHVQTIANDRNINNKFEKWWYRKQFQCIISDQQMTQSVYLTFKSSANDTRDIHDSVPTSIFAVVWLDAVQIFSDSLVTPEISIELPQKLLRSDKMDDRNHKHTLIVCCMNTCLSFHACLTVPYGTICSSEGDQLKQTDTSDDIEEYVNIDLDSNQLISTSTVGEKEVTTENKIQINNLSKEVNQKSIPLLSIVMLIVGTRGDVQPFIAYGKALRAAGHRVRLATHENFRNFVREHDLEFFPLDGDPNEMMSLMVKNSGVLPSVNTIKSGNLLGGRRMFREILDSTWLACISDDDETGAPFRAEAIIANPVSYGHIHCAQKLGIPLHMVFTMPYSSTTAFPHPLGNIDYSKESRERLNMLSYRLVETTLWLCIGDIINTFRHDVLGLPSLNVLQATSLIVDEKVPYTYCWSPSLVPKPPDWPWYVDVSGFFFLDLATNYTTPPHDLLTFLGLSSDSNTDKTELSPPIFIGFGSIAGHDSHRLLDVILQALMQTGYRAILAGFDVEPDRLTKTIFKIDEIPYDWLFQHVSAVCHHGGAGTTAAALRAGKPNIVIPFFGDQFFWGNIVRKSGAGPSPLPGKHVTVEQLVEAFKFVYKPEVQAAAQHLQENILKEDGCAAAVRAFHTYLPLPYMHSDLEPTYAACFRLDDFNLQVSRPVAQVLLSAGVVNESQFRYHSTRKWRLPSGKPRFDDGLRAADFDLNASTSRITDYYGLKNNANQLQTGFPRPRALTNTAEMLVTAVNRMVEFTMNTLGLEKEFGERTHVSRLPNVFKNNDIMKQPTTNTSNLASLSLSNNIDDQKQNPSDDISILARNAASISGFSPEVCQDILLKFDKLKKEREKMIISPSKKRYQANPLTRERSRSASDF